MPASTCSRKMGMYGAHDRIHCQLTMLAIRQGTNLSRHSNAATKPHKRARRVRQPGQGSGLRAPRAGDEGGVSTGVGVNTPSGASAPGAYGSQDRNSTRCWRIRLRRPTMRSLRVGHTATPSRTYTTCRAAACASSRPASLAQVTVVAESQMQGTTGYDPVPTPCRVQDWQGTSTSP